ncbi:hypothetical protein [Microbispora sp. NPDC049125]|uniref:hypothetical protein n=1 Tax=Microbispora sp. NPDC049125 TaxID=3154929 RepID=UPI003466FC8E
MTIPQPLQQALDAITAETCERLGGIHDIVYAEVANLHQVTFALDGGQLPGRVGRIRYLPHLADYSPYIVSAWSVRSDSQRCGWAGHSTAIRLDDVDRELRGCAAFAGMWAERTR